MAFINPKQKEIVCKIVYAGAPFSGKSTSLRKIYDHMGGKKPVTLSDETLFFDFVPLSLGKIDGMNVHFHLYTLPPQKTYDTTCKMILKGLDGVIFVVDSQIQKVQESFESFESLKKQIETENPWAKISKAFQYNKRDLKEAIGVKNLHNLFNPDNSALEFESVATKGTQVIEAFQAVMKSVLLELKR